MAGNPLCCTTFGSGVSTETSSRRWFPRSSRRCTTFGSGVSTETAWGRAGDAPVRGLHDLRLRGEY